MQNSNNINQPGFIDNARIGNTDFPQIYKDLLTNLNIRQDIHNVNSYGNGAQDSNSIAGMRVTEGPTGFAAPINLGVDVSEYENLSNLYKEGKITKDELIKRSNKITQRNYDKANLGEILDTSRIQAGAGISALGGVLPNPAVGGAAIMAGNAIMNNKPLLPTVVDTTLGGVGGAALSKIAPAAAKPIADVYNKYVPQGVKNMLNMQLAKQQSKPITQSLGGDAVMSKPNPTPAEFQEVYHSSPTKNIKQFNPIENFGQTDPGFYAKNATYFSPEVQNSIPYGARINADAYLKNPKTHSDWVKNQIGYLANEATDIYSGTINPERFRNSIINEIEYRNNVGDLDKAKELMKALSDYNGNTASEMGSIYRTQIPADKYLLDWDEAISNQSEAVRELAKELNVPLNKTGEALYNNLLKQSENDAIKTNLILDNRGIPGFTAGNTIGIEKGVFNPKNMIILEESSVLDPKFREFIK